MFNKNSRFSKLVYKPLAFLVSLMMLFLRTPNLYVRAEESVPQPTQTSDLSEVSDNINITVNSNEALVNAFKIYDGKGTVKYRLGENGNWLDELPKMNNAGSQVLYYYVKGNTTYNDLGSEQSPKKVTVTVSSDQSAAPTAANIDTSNWGTKYVENGITFYVSDDGTTSAVIQNEITWLKEKNSDGTSTWYGIRNPIKRDGSYLFEPGSRFWVRWLTPSDKDDETKNIDDQFVDDFNAGNLWVFHIGVTAPDGTEYKNFYKEYGVEVPVYIGLVGSDWDKTDLDALFIVDGTDISAGKDFFISYLPSLDGSPVGGAFAKLTLQHFSLFGVGSKLTYGNKSSTKSTLSSSSTKTGGTTSKTSATTTKTSGSTSSNKSSSSPYYTSSNLSGLSSSYKKTADGSKLALHSLIVLLPTTSLLAILYKRKKKIHEKD